MSSFSPEQFAALTPASAIEGLERALDRARLHASLLMKDGGDWGAIDEHWIRPWCELRLQWNQADFFASLSGQEGWSLGTQEREIQRLLSEVRTSPRVWESLNAANPGSVEGALVRNEMKRAHWASGVTLADRHGANEVLQGIYKIVEEYEALLASRASAAELKPRLMALLDLRRKFAAAFELSSFHEYVAKRSLSSTAHHMEDWLAEAAKTHMPRRPEMPPARWTWEEAKALALTIAAKVFDLRFEIATHPTPEGLELLESDCGFLYLQRVPGKIQPMTIGLAPRSPQGRPAALVRCGFSEEMTLGNLRTFLHEFGHALQHLLTRLQSPIISGLESAPMDFVEVSSSFIEDFLLQDWAYEGRSLSDCAIRECQTYHREFQAGRLRNQARLAQVDLVMHGTKTCTAADLEAMEPNYHRFHHVIVSRYAGSYFSYAIGRHFSDRLHEHPSTSLDFGRSFRGALYDVEGRRNPSAALTSMLDSRSVCES